MRKSIILYLLMAVLYIVPGIYSYRTATAADTKPRIAFLLFVPQNIEAASLMETIPTLLTSAVNRTNSFEIVERRKVDKEILLKGYQISSLKTEELSNVGNALGLDFTVYGDVKKDSSIITASIKALDIKAQKPCFEHTLTVSEGMLNDKLNEMSIVIANQILKCFAQVVVSKKTEEYLASPYDLNATAADKKIRLMWRHKNIQDISGFKIYRATSKYETYMLIDAVPDLTFLDHNPPLNKPLFYKVTAVYKNGRESESSNIVESRLALGPPPPIFLNVTPDIKSLHLKWRAHPKSEVSGFKIYRRETSEKEFKEITSVSADITAYTDKGLNDNILYYYALSSTDNKGTGGDLSAILSATTLKTPDGFKAESGKIRRISLNWDSHPSDVVKGYRVYRSVDKISGYKRVAEIDGKMSNYYLDKKDLGDLITYWYRIVAYNNEGIETDMSDAVSATTRGKPPVPQGFIAKDREPRRVTLRWDVIKNPDDEITGYVIFRATEENGEYKKIAEINNPEENSFIDKDSPLKDNAIYYYKIASYNSAGVSSDLSSPMSSTTKALPSIPKGLSAKSGEVKQITLMWEPNLEKDIKVYNIYRVVSDDENFKIIASVKGKTNYIDADLKDGAKYTYSIEAVDEDNLISERSSLVTAMTKPLPAKPSGLKISDEGGKKILHWDANPEKDIKQYNIYKKGFFGIPRKIAEVQTNSWVIDEIKGKLEIFIKALDETGLESEGSNPIIVESKK